MIGHKKSYAPDSLAVIVGREVLKHHGSSPLFKSTRGMAPDS